jgi:Rrf2 family protein
MRVSTKSDYALRALIELASHDDEQAMSADEIGQLQDIPLGFLKSILSDLRRAGLVLARRGQFGGWLLNRDPATLSVADVMRAMDGPLVSVYGIRPEGVAYNERAAALQHVWVAARQSLRDVFEQVTVAQLARQELPDAIAELIASDDAWQPH